MPLLGLPMANRLARDSKLIMHSEKTGITITSCRKGKFRLDIRKKFFDGSDKALGQVTQ